MRKGKNEGRVCLSLRGDDFDPEQVSSIIGIAATACRRKGNPLPENSSWDYSTQSVVGECVNVYEMSSSLVKKLAPYTEGIRKAKERFNLEATLQVVLTVTQDDSICTPAIGFDREVLEFVHKIEGTIDIDTYRG
jgi:hypothetical protein